MQQVFCKLSTKTGDVRCPICHQAFTVFWSLHSPSEKKQSARLVEACLREHHDAAVGSQDSDPFQIHPSDGFNVPDWLGLADDSAEALVGVSGD